MWNLDWQRYVKCVSPHTHYSEGLIKSKSVRRLTLSHRFNVAVLRSAAGTPSDPSARLQEYQDEFSGLPQPMSSYHTRPRPESVLQKDDVISGASSSLLSSSLLSSSLLSSSSGATSPDKPMEVGQLLVQPSSTTFTPSWPTGMPIPSDSPVIRPPPGLEDQPVKYSSRPRPHTMVQSQS
eukprot:2283575-Amphidinium_carterae.5